MGRHHHRHHHHHRYHHRHRFHRASLKLIRGRGSIHIAPPRFADDQARPARHCFPNGGRAGTFSAGPAHRDANSIWRGEGSRTAPVRALGNDGLHLGDISKARGDPAAADRARGLRGQRRGQKHHLYRRSRRRQPAVPRQLPRRNPGVHENLSQQPRRRARRGHGRAGAAYRRRPAALCQLPALCRRGNPTVPIASRASAPFSLSMAGSIVSSRTPASPAPVRSMRRFRNWER